MADEPRANPVMIHQEEVIPTGQHDTHFYDPDSPDDHRLMVVYETRARAEDARQRLVDSGLPAAAIELVDRTGEQVEADSGVWGAIKRFLIPDEDAHGYAESVHRGHAILVVRPEDSRRVEVIRALEETDPLDFDARLEEWRAAGWNGISARQAQGGTGVTVAAPGAAPANQAASIATTTAVGQAATVVQTRDTAATSGTAAEKVTTGAKPLQPGSSAPPPAPPQGQAYDTATRPAAAAPRDPGLGNAAATTGAAAAGSYAGSGGFTGGTFTGTDASVPGAASAQRQRATGGEYARVRGYGVARPADSGPAGAGKEGG